jgi:clan AA aspartic protease
MGLIRTKVTLKNPRRPELPVVEAEALADCGSVHLCIPLAVQNELQLEEFRKEQVTFADGSKNQVPYVGPVQILFKGRVGFAGALVFGDEVLFGAIPMEDMDLIVIPRTRTFDVNPLSPEMATSIAK